MTKEQLAALPRISAEELLMAISVALSPSQEKQLLIAVEGAMSQEWWRGYHAGRAKLDGAPS
jgi:hypothetical protein